MERKQLVVALAAVAGLALGAPGLAGAEQHTGGSADGMQSEQSQAAASGSPIAQAVADMKVSDLKDKTLVNANGEEIGTIENVVSDGDGQLHAVVSVGGILGIGDKKVAIPVAQIDQKDGNLLTDSPITADELKVAEFKESAYSEIDGDMTLADAYREAQQQMAAAPPSEPAGEQVAGADAQAGAGAQQPPGAAAGIELAAFEELDSNQDGFVNREEAQNEQQLIQNWDQVDQDSDGQISQTEFSAFEAQPSGGAATSPMAPAGAAEEGTTGEDAGAGAGMANQEAGATGELAAFDQLDADRDGYISEQEAQQHPRLSDNWQAADVNADGQVDPAEFSAFEAGVEAPTGGGGDGAMEQPSPTGDGASGSNGM